MNFLNACRMLAFVSLLSATAIVSAGEPIGPTKNGRWVKDENFIQLNTRCHQVWQCMAKEDILHGQDTTVRTSKPESTYGTCNAAGGAIDSCNICAASEPATKCQWWIEKK